MAQIDEDFEDAKGSVGGPEKPVVTRDTFRPMSCSRFLSAYWCDADFDLDGDYCIHIWEPLDVPDLPPDARPSCYLTDSIDFYDNTGNKHLWRKVRHHTIQDCLLFVNGTWWHIASGQVMHHNGRWCMRWWGNKTSSEASVMNRGYEAYRR